MMPAILSVALAAATPCKDWFASSTFAAECTDDPTYGACTREGDACSRLAMEAQQAISAGIRAEFTVQNADVQPPRAPARTTAGTSDAAESLRPVGIAAASLALTGTSTGAKPRAAVSLNPAGLATTGSDPRDFATFSRLLDVTVLLPLSSELGIPPDVGVNLNVDIAAAMKGMQLVDRAKTAAAAHEQVLTTAGALVASLKRALESAGDAKADCVALLTRPVVHLDEVEQVCRVALTREVKQLREREAAFAKELVKLRRDADDLQAGLQIKLDVPIRAPGMPDLRPFLFDGRGVFALRSSGRVRIGGRGSAGVHTACILNQCDLLADLAAAATADIGLEVSEVHVSAGVRGMFSATAAPSMLMLPDRNFLDINLTVAVPLFGGAAIALTVAWPLWRDNVLHGPSVSVAGDWAYLLSRVVGAPGS